MRADEQEMQRLGSGGAPPSSLEARAGAFLREASPLTGISNAQIDVIETSLVGQARVRRGLRLVPVLVAVVVLLVAGSVMAVASGWRPRLHFFAPAPSSQDSSPSHSPKAKVASAALTDPVAVPSVESPAREPRPQPAAHRPLRVEPSAAPRAPLAEAPPVESALSAEARSLADALARWRRDGQAEAALAGLPRARELETLRGELRAHAGRCRDARADLSPVLASGGTDDLSRRAARALATCP